MTETSFDRRLSDRFRQDAAGLETQLRARATGADGVRRRGDRRRRIARATLALCTALAVCVVALTAWQIRDHRDPAVAVDQGDLQTPSAAIVETATTAATTSPTTAPPPATVLPDPSGAGALPLEWQEVPGQLPTLGTMGTADDGFTYSLFDATAAQPFTLGGTPNVREPEMTIARSRDGVSWETVATKPWASGLTVSGGTVIVVGLPGEDTGPALRLRLGTSDDGGRSWDEVDVDAGEITGAPLLNPLPRGLPQAGVGMNPPPYGPENPPTSVRVDPPAQPGNVEPDHVRPPVVVSGAAGTLAVMHQHVPVDGVVPRCTGSRHPDSLYWYEYRDGVTVQVAPAGDTPNFQVTVVTAGTPPPARLVRCTVDIDASAVRPRATITTTLVGRDGDGPWQRLDTDLPDTDNGWQVIALGDGFVAESRSTTSGVRQLRSVDGTDWAEFDRPPGWPTTFGDVGAAAGTRAIGLDTANRQVATSSDGGDTWIRVDVADLPVPESPDRAESFQLLEGRVGPLGYALRYYAAKGDKFWRVMATSRDGRTWATFDETAAGINTGALGARLAVVGPNYVMSSHDSAPTGPAVNGTFQIGYTTRTFIGTPVGGAGD